VTGGQQAIAACLLSSVLVLALLVALAEALGVGPGIL
jgi:hypothetical protein